MRLHQEWDLLEKDLRAAHADSVAAEWVDDRDAFVRTLLEYAKEAYTCGYEDALDDIRDSASQCSTRMGYHLDGNYEGDNE